MARRRRRTRAILGALIVLVLAAGAVAVFTLVYHQAKSNDRSNKAEAVQRKAAAGTKVSGVVVSVNAKGVTIRLANFSTRRMSFSPTTLVENAMTGADSDIRTGKHAFVSLTPGQLNVAQEVVVLPGGGPLGTPVSKAGKNFMQLRSKGGSVGALIGTGRAKVRNAVPAKPSDIKVGMHLIAHVRPTTSKPVAFSASQIVLLPTDSHFG